MYKEVEKLETAIDKMKKGLIVIARETGLNSNDTLRYSQKLDKLIMRYQRLLSLHG